MLLLLLRKPSKRPQRPLQKLFSGQLPHHLHLPLPRRLTCYHCRCRPRVRRWWSRCRCHTFRSGPRRPLYLVGGLLLSAALLSHINLRFLHLPVNCSSTISKSQTAKAVPNCSVPVAFELTGQRRHHRQRTACSVCVGIQRRKTPPDFGFCARAEVTVPAQAVHHPPTPPSALSQPVTPPPQVRLTHFFHDKENAEFTV